MGRAGRWFFVILLALQVDGVKEQLMAQQGLQHEVSLKQVGDRIVVHVGDGERMLPFTEYRFAGFRKPVMYPVLGPGQVSVTRHYPIEEGVAGEATDHPHHKSIWFAHGDVNGLDFWSEKASIRHRSIDQVEGNRLIATNDWMDGDEVLCSDQTTVEFFAGTNWRRIDYNVVVRATHQDLVFGDTKEGTFAVRTHPALRLIDLNKQPAGQAFNSEGVEGQKIWGKEARWVHYRGVIDGEPYSITVMDDPGNLRHPTTWHAREYGLVAANPFGLSYFSKAEKGAGDFRLAKGQVRPFRYGVLIHRGELTVEQIENHFREFSDHQGR